jgi:hypothetical protein
MGMTYEEKYFEYDKYIKLVVDHEHGHNTIPEIENIDYSLAKEELSENEFKIFIIYSCFKKAMNGDGAEIIDIAEDTLKELKNASLDLPLSAEFINSLFSFDSIYKVMYDLLSLAVDGEYRGVKKSKDYIDGIIDSIVVLKKFQRYNGFGDFEWTVRWNDAINHNPKGA